MVAFGEPGKAAVRAIGYGKWGWIFRAGAQPKPPISNLPLEPRRILTKSGLARTPIIGFEWPPGRLMGPGGSNP